MKNLFAVYFLAFILCSSDQVMGFDFGNFFFGDGSSPSDTSKRSPELPKIDDLSNINATIPVYSETEIDPTTINSTFDDEFVDLFPLNVSENVVAVENSSVLESVTAKQSIKKQLIDIPPTAPRPSVTLKPGQELSQSAKDTAASAPGELNVTLNTDEPEEVVLGTIKAPDILEEKTIFQKGLDWLENTYTLSILLPVAAGVLFAATCIITIALCGCIRRCCRRRRLKKKIMLPDSVKSLRASDRKRLLGDCSSDEEF